jgi:hypothetical protein
MLAGESPGLVALAEWEGAHADSGHRALPALPEKRRQRSRGDDGEERQTTSLV